MSQSSTEKALPATEHRLVTILFADVVGSTALSGGLEPETSRMILDRCMRLMSQSVDKVGGTVARLMGDGMLAFFGAPTSHEDDPERAALAALDIHDSVVRYGRELDTDLQVRIGVNTGRVVMGEVGGETLSEYTAMGQPINLAARLQASAEPGTTLIGETTCRMIIHRFETQAIPALTLKGFEGEVPAFRLLQLRDRADAARGIPGIVTPLIGREKELEKIVSMLHDLQSGRGAIATVIGEPGIGKSRLLQEAFGAMGDAPITYAQGQASSYTVGQPFSVIRDLLRGLLRINTLDSPAMIDLKIEKELVPLFEERLGEIWPPIALLLGAPVPPQYADHLEALEPEALNRSMTAAFCQLIEALANQQAMVLGFDDLHWADPSSLDLLEALFLAAEHGPVLIVLLFRPDRESRIWELKTLAERDFGHRYHGVSLEALSQTESRQLTARVLSNEKVPEKVHELLLEKSEGNPFFLEELLHELMESDTFVSTGGAWEMSREIHSLRVPETLQEVVQARVDRLDPDERMLLQSAAVIGKRFGSHLLETITPNSENLPAQLLTLQRAGLIREWSRQPELTYDFKQSAVQEVTYQRLLAEQRRDLHRRVGQSLESMYVGQLDEHAAMLAHHFSLGEDNSRAYQYHRMAGDKALRLNANLEAIEHFSKAIELTQDQDDAPTDELSHLHLSLGRVYEHLAQYNKALEVYDKLHELGDTRGEPRVALQARLAKNTLRVTPTPLFDAEVGRQKSEEALELARSLNDPQAEAKTLWHLGLLGRLTAHDAEAIRYLEQSLAIAEAHGLEEQIGFTLTDLYWSYLVGTHLDMSRQTIERAHDVWEKLGNLPMMVDTLAGQVFVQFLAGEYQGAIETAHKALALSEKIDNLWGKSYSQSYIGFVYIDLGEIDLAFEIMERSIELGIKAGFFVPGVTLPAMRALTVARLGGRSEEHLISDTTPENFKKIVGPILSLVNSEIHVQKNELELAKRFLDEGLKQVALISTMHLVFPPELAMASYCDAAGQYERVIEVTAAAIDKLIARGIVCRLPQFYYLQANALNHLGKRAAAMESLESALALTTDSGARWPTWQLLALRAQLLSDAGEAEKAAEDWRSAADMVAFIADNIGDDDLRNAFSSKPDVRAILEVAD